MRRTLKAALLSLLACGVLAGPASAASFVVNDLADGTDQSLDGTCDANGPAGCTLRAAIEEANQNGGGQADSITFSVSGTHTLTLGPLFIYGGETVTIDGNGAGAGGTAISGGDTFRVLFINAESPTFVTLSDLRIQDGYVNDAYCCNGAGIASRWSTLTLERVAVVDNTINVSAAGAAGAGINASGPVAITDSTIAGNTILSEYGSGAGLYAGSGAATISRTTFSDNVTSASGSVGGAHLSNSYGTTVTNSTFSGNTGGTTSGVGAILSSTPVTITNTTIAGNTGGLTSGIRMQGGSNPAATLRNTILANDPATNCSTDGGGATISGDRSIDSGMSCGFSSAAGNQSGTNPLLGALADNGGPTQTRLPAANSPAVDTGNDTHCPVTDQGGEIRPRDGDGNGTTVCDIGSVEREAPPAPQCSDGTDNDADGNTDHPADPGCESTTDDSEGPDPVTLSVDDAQGAWPMNSAICTQGGGASALGTMPCYKYEFVGGSSEIPVTVRVDRAAAHDVPFSWSAHFTDVPYSTALGFSSPSTALLALNAASGSGTIPAGDTSTQIKLGLQSKTTQAGLSARIRVEVATQPAPGPTRTDPQRFRATVTVGPPPEPPPLPAPDPLEPLTIEPAPVEGVEVSCSGHPAWGRTSWEPDWSWLSDENPVPGATKRSFTPTYADVGRELACRATAPYVGIADTSPAVVVGLNPLAPSGGKVRVDPDDPRSGGTLTCESAGWNRRPDSFSYRWFARGEVLRTQTKRELAKAPAKGPVACEVVAANAHGHSARVRSPEVPLGTPLGAFEPASVVTVLSAAQLPIRCAAATDCTGTLALSDAVQAGAARVMQRRGSGRSLGRARFRIRRGKRTTVRVRLTRRARAQLRTRRTMRVVGTAVLRSGRSKMTMKRRFSLRAARR